MSMQPAAPDPNTWDAKLIARISEPAGRGRREGAGSVLLPMLHVPFLIATAAVTGAPLVVASAIASVLLTGGRIAWPRAKRGRARRTAERAMPNPFGR